jgi:hypothetical protein
LDPEIDLSNDDDIQYLRFLVSAPFGYQVMYSGTLTNLTEILEGGAGTPLEEVAKVVYDFNKGKSINTQVSHLYEYYRNDIYFSLNISKLLTFIQV